MGFEHIWAFALLPLPLLAWRLLPPLPEEVGLPVPAGVEALLVQLSSGSGHGRFGWPGGIALAVTGWIALVVALAGPQTENRQLLKPTGRDLIIALDLSASMAVEDMSANGQPARRYAIVRDLAGQFINQREGDRVGLIAFAQRAFLIAPLTFDTKAVSGLLDELSIGLPGRKTDVGKAVGLTIQTLRQEPEADRVLVLLSDGEQYRRVERSRGRASCRRPQYPGSHHRVFGKCRKQWLSGLAGNSRCYRWPVFRRSIR